MMQVMKAHAKIRLLFHLRSEHIAELTALDEEEVVNLNATVHDVRVIQMIGNSLCVNRVTQTIVRSRILTMGITFQRIVLRGYLP